jgi:hypothetical protein
LKSGQRIHFIRPAVLWPSLFVAVTVAVVLIGLPGWLAMPAILASFLLAVRAFVAGRTIRRSLSLLAGALIGWIAFVTAAAGVPHVSVSGRSPDGAVVAEVYETTAFLDRHFSVRLTSYWLGIIPMRRVVYLSPDEGPRGGERLVWSRDGRRVLLLGPNLFGIHAACLSSGEVLYLLVDAQTGATASNASQAGRDHPRFSLDDVAAMGFDITLKPGTWDRRSHRCVPGTRESRR